MQNNHGVFERSGKEQAIFLIVQSIIIIFLVYGAFLAYQYYYNTKHTDNGDRSAYAQVLSQYNKEGIYPVEFRELTPLLAEQAMLAYNQECLIINSKQTYLSMMKKVGGELCEACGTINFAKYSIIGKPMEEVIDGPDVAGGFDVHVFDDTNQQKLTYIIVSNAFKQTNARTFGKFAQNAHAAYLDEAQNWLVKIPKLKEGYTVECVAHTQY